MKKTLLLSIIIVSVFALASCASKEEKAAKLIKTELSKKLFDFDSYQPIETIVKEAKVSRYNDSACWNKALVMAYAMQKSSDYFKEAEDAREHMLIWGRPTSYSSSYSDMNYSKYKNQYIENLESANNTLILINAMANNLHSMVEELDTTQVAGWEVDHSFRCKTKGGNTTIAHYRYVLSKNFKTVILYEDTENDDNKHAHSVLDAIPDMNNFSSCSEESTSEMSETIARLKVVL